MFCNIIFLSPSKWHHPFLRMGQAAWIIKALKEIKWKHPLFYIRTPQGICCQEVNRSNNALHRFLGLLETKWLRRSLNWIIGDGPMELKLNANCPKWSTLTWIVLLVPKINSADIDSSTMHVYLLNDVANWFNNASCFHCTTCNTR